MLYSAFKDPSGLLGGGTFFSESPDDASPRDRIKGTYLDYTQRLANSNTRRKGNPSVSQRPPSPAAPNPDIAPWMSEGLPSLSSHGFMTDNFFDDGPMKPQGSSSHRPDNGRMGDCEISDPMFHGGDRRPSLASATTVSSQNSKASTSRGTPQKKLGGFFGDDGPQSSRSSDTSIPSTLQRELTSSSRHNSLQASHNDSGTASPTSSRPRTPLPSSDVTPWLFQEFKVSICGYPAVIQSTHSCF